MTQDSRLRAEIIREAAALRALAPAWWDLFGRVAAAPPFVSPAWLLPWWDVFAPGALHAVAVWHGDRLMAFAPLYLENGPFGRRLLPLGIGLSDTLDVLLDPVVAPPAWAAILDALRATAAEWDFWSAEETAPDAAVLAAAVDPPWSRDVAAQSACPVLPLPTGQALAGIPSGMMRKWRMARHRGERRRSRLIAADPGTLPGLLADLVRLHGARWHTRGEAGVLADERVARFHAQAAPALLEAGLLHLTGLVIDDVMAGVYYGFRSGSRHFAYLQGFDPAFAFESPGTLLVGAAIEDAVASGATAFDFLRGQEPYKYRWGAIDRWNSRCTFRLRP